MHNNLSRPSRLCKIWFKPTKFENLFFQIFFLNQNTKNCPKEFLVNLSKKPRNTDKSETCLEHNSFAIIPYIKGTSEPIKIMLAKHKVKTALEPLQNLSQLFPKPKDKLQKQQMTGAIYSIPCKNCEKTYIGQTKRQFGTWLKKHKKALTNYKFRFGGT